MLEDFLKYQAKTTPHPLGLEIEHASGSYLYDTQGKSYLDFVAGVSALPLGHSHPKVVSALKSQIEKYMHVMVYGEFAQAPAVALCKTLVELLPKNHEVIYLTNSGTEAIEGALKLAKRVTQRSGLVAAHRSYHGSTHGALSLLGYEQQKKGYRPLLPGVRFLHFNAEKDLDQIDKNTAAVLLETIQGGAGFILPEDDYLKKVKKRCEEVGALLLLDEIQPGFGRTGKMFGFEHFGIAPDIVVMGKALGGGLPIGAFSASKKLMQKLEDQPKLGHITTFGGNPVIATAALTTINEIISTKLTQQISHKERIFRENLKHPMIKSISGKGLMLAPIFERPEIPNYLVPHCIEKGLLLFWLLWEKNAIRISPPLNISEEEIILGCEIIKEALDEI
ncbi:MAG: aspartate aminotransferase family protein [Flavobacteriaceae bacterium]|jgi:acetylornithine/succinyldiaminopimelate/putrescine aminotransferase|nr:aspartate aminotransferase family protein [Flavobacteriaceae bacterium]MBT6128211.1 aspartate aminotransferase family protein [Flavobacteriaceae bacterium]MCH1453425.1 aspartate aminotransferase family protein [Flavobacteriaceae bacterium]MDG1027671.1 aspartate aminotransferase family protein [Flavobacteriaceae bacterium]